MNRHTVLARISLLLASILGSINVASGSWLVTDGEAGKVSASEKISSDSTKAVCYIKETGVYYTSLDRALEVAEKERPNEADTICVIPNLGTTVNITSNHTINSGDSLVLPYDGETCYNSTEHGAASVEFADGSKELVDTYRKTQVVLAKGKALTVYGTVSIGGVLSRPKNIGISGQTTGDYCEMVLNSGSNITICDQGRVNCYGYIKKAITDNDDVASSETDTDGSTTENPGITIESGGTLLSPFVIYDAKGGGQTTAILSLKQNKFCPFQIFDFCNIQAKVRVNAGASWMALACLFIETLPIYIQIDDLCFISSQDESAIVLDEGHIDVKYTPESKSGYTTSNGHTSVVVDGTANVGVIKTKVWGYPLDSSEFFFPLSYKFDFTILSGSTFNVGKMVKLMPGCSLIIENVARMNVSAPVAIYDGSYTESGTSSNSKYPDKDVSGNDIPNAALINNGIINVDGNGAIGGFISTDNDNTEDTFAELNYHSRTYEASSPEFSKYTTSLETRTVKYTAKGNVLLNDAVKENFNITINDYQSCASGSAAVWKNLDNLYAVSFDKTDDKQDTTCGSATLVAAVNDATEFSSSYSCAWSIDTTNANIGLTATNGNTTTITNSGEENATVSVTLTVTKGDESMKTTKDVMIYKKETSAAKKDIESVSISSTLVWGTTNMVYDAGKDNITVFKLTANVEPYPNDSIDVKYIWGLSKKTVSNMSGLANNVKFKTSNSRNITENLINVGSSASNSTDFNKAETYKDISKCKWFCTSPSEYNQKIIYLSFNGAYANAPIYVSVMVTFTNQSGSSTSIVATNYLTFTRGQLIQS